MHASVVTWLRNSLKAIPTPKTLLDIGGRNVNGSIKDLFPGVVYKALDLHDGPGVDIVADARSWEPTETFDLIVSTGTFEHVQGWERIPIMMFKACRPGGHVLLTMAGPGFGAHSAHGGPLQPGEWYAEPDPQDLHTTLSFAGFANVHVTLGHATGRTPPEPCFVDLLAYASRPY